MTAFDVHPVEPGRCGKLRRPDVGALKLVEVVVAHQRIVAGQVVLGIERRAVVGNHRPRGTLRLAVSPRMSQLKHRHDLMPERFPRGLAGFGDQAGISVDVILVQVELPWIGADLVEHRGGLEPDQPRTALGVAAVATEAQLSRRAVRRGVEALHRLHRETVRGSTVADANTIAEDRHVLVNRQVQSDPVQLRAEQVKVLEVKSFVFGHVRDLSRLLARPVAWSPATSAT